MNYDLIKNAIIERQQVHAKYHGYYRQMCPHVIGTKGGVRQALFYQFAGDSSQGRIITQTAKNWRCIPVDDLSEIKIVDGEWFTFGNHSTRQRCVDVIDVEVEY